MVIRQLYFWLACVLLVLIPQAAIAAPNFIASSRVSEDTLGATVEIRFNCKVSYQHHEPAQRGDTLRIYLEPTSICNGVSPLAVQSRGRYRPVNSDIAQLLDFEYDGSSSTLPFLTLNFAKPVDFSVEASSVSFELLIHVSPESDTAVPAPKSTQSVQHRQVIRPQPDAPVFAINLQSFRRIPTIADVSA